MPGEERRRRRRLGRYEPGSGTGIPGPGVLQIESSGSAPGSTTARRMRSHIVDPDPAGDVFNGEEHLQPLQGDGVDVEQVAGDPRLPSPVNRCQVCEAVSTIRSALASSPVRACHRRMSPCPYAVTHAGGITPSTPAAPVRPGCGRDCGRNELHHLVSLFCADGHVVERVRGEATPNSSRGVTVGATATFRLTTCRSTGHRACPRTRSTTRRTAVNSCVVTGCSTMTSSSRSLRSATSRQ